MSISRAEGLIENVEFIYIFFLLSFFQGNNYDGLK